MLAAVTAVAVAGCGGRAPNPAGGSPDRAPVRTAGCARHTGPPRTSIDGTPQPANQAVLDEIADRITSIAEQRYGEVYAGLELVQEQDRLRVYRKPSKGFDAWILRDFRTDCVEVIDAAHSAVELQALADRIAGDIDYWDQHGVRVNTISARFDGSGVEVGTVDVAKAREEMPKRYGPAIPILVEQQEPIQPAIGVS